MIYSVVLTFICVQSENYFDERRKKDQKAKGESMKCEGRVEFSKVREMEFYKSSQEIT